MLGQLRGESKPASDRLFGLEPNPHIASKNLRDS